MDADEAPGWTQHQCEMAERWYRRFLTLALTDGSEAIVPPQPVDKFWHKHILDTQKYIADCEAVFGSYLHHFPYFGLRGPEGAAALDAAFERTQQLLEEFGESLDGMYEAFGQSGKTALCMPRTTCRTR